MTTQTALKCLHAALAALALAAAAPALGADNPLAPPPGTVAIDGVWNGTDLERRTNCTNAQNEGSRGTYAEFDVSTDALAHVMAITQKGITGLTCNYYGDYPATGLSRSWSGTYSCSDGKHGTFRSLAILVTQNALSIHLGIQLDTTETCAIDAVIGAGRFYP